MSFYDDYQEKLNLIDDISSKALKVEFKKKILYVLNWNMNTLRMLYWKYMDWLKQYGYLTWWNARLSFCEKFNMLL